MANLSRNAKSGSDWTDNELLAFNIRVANANTETIFNTTQLPSARVSDTILDNAEKPDGQLPKDDRLFFRYLGLVERPQSPESHVDDFAAHILRILNYDDQDRVICQRPELPFIMSGQRVDAKSDLCVKDDNDYLLLVHEDKRSGSLDDPEPQLIAEAIAEDIQKETHTRLNERGHTLDETQHTQTKCSTPHEVWQISQITSAPVTKPTNISQSSSSGRITTTSRRASSRRITASESLPTPNAVASIPASIPEVQPMQVVEPLLNDLTSYTPFIHSVEPQVAQFVEGSSSGQGYTWAPYVLQSPSYNANHTWTTDHTHLNNIGFESFDSFYGVNALEGLTDFDFAQNLAPDDWYSYTRYSNEEPYNYPDTLLPPFPSSSPPPMSSSPAPSEFAPSMSIPPPAQTPSDHESSTSRAPIIDGKGKKRARDEVDERDILPTGSRRTAHRPTRVPVLVASTNGN